MGQSGKIGRLSLRRFRPVLRGRVPFFWAGYEAPLRANPDPSGRVQDAGKPSQIPGSLNSLERVNGKIKAQVKWPGLSDFLGLPASSIYCG